MKEGKGGRSQIDLQLGPLSNGRAVRVSAFLGPVLPFSTGLVDSVGSSGRSSAVL